MAITRNLIIGGEHVPAASGRTAEDINPYTGGVYATVAAAGVDDVTRAVAAADAASEAWAAAPPSFRAKIFLKAADILESRTDEGAELMAQEVGGVRPWAEFNLHLAAEILRSAAAATTAPQGEVLATNLPGKYSLSLRQPFGVVAAISPWNAPFILGTRALAIPLAVGNTVVLKPSEDAPLACGLFLADALLEAGLPDGVLNVVTNAREDANEVVGALISDDRVRCVNFTGSTHVGRIIGTLAAQHLKPSVLELGGKNSLVVLKDADIEYAASAATFGAFMNAGQICMSVDRVIVDRSIAEDFTARFVEKVSRLPTGDPNNADTFIGPQVNQSAADRQYGLIEDAVAKGATVATGGQRLGNAVVPATVLTGITEDMRVFGEEIFGAATTVMPVAGAEEALRLANGTKYGLTAGVITENLSEGIEVAQRLRTGIAHVNDQPVQDEPMAPFGGIKESGYGKFGGQAGINSFTELRWITVQQRGHAPYPF
ncbi:salicylaldehyde dehydrogenase [Zafaria cholistanensis]|uniref:Salicylaldehyde dehydrogenase n=1 Tax=Zafaria cholistanensis TaxID=1682741 RepID=A0A5A7NSA3_9MICC|nr:aldehyde dehydrogenase family protein [Zafaria cholistanensis]GER22992.1 salicylaldehyde dehydrogenase [Zafaria cholistanensis]